MQQTSSSNTKPGQKLTPKPAKIIAGNKDFQIPTNASSEQYNNIVKNCIDFIHANKLQDKPITIDSFKKEGADALKQLIRSNVPVNGLEDKSNTLAKKDKEDISLLNQAAINVRKELNGKRIPEKDFAKRLNAEVKKLKSPGETSVMESTLTGVTVQLVHDRKTQTSRIDPKSINSPTNKPATQFTQQAILAGPPMPKKRKELEKQKASNLPTPKPSVSQTAPKPEEPALTHTPNWMQKAAEAQENIKSSLPLPASSPYALPTVPQSPLKIVPGSN